METGTKRSQRDYTLAFKLSVVEQVEKGQLTCKQAQERYGIQGRSTVLVWLRKHGRQGWGGGASCAVISRQAHCPGRQRQQARCEQVATIVKPVRGRRVRQLRRADIT